MSGELERCFNCDRVIGRLEQAYLYRGNVVCDGCYAKLTPPVETNFHDTYDPTGGVKSMVCPSCGAPASEYQQNKWECLSCGRRFVYEPPRHPDQYVRVEKVEKLDDSSFFICGYCGGKFPRHSHAEYVCKRCKKSFCQEHINKKTQRCKRCDAAVRSVFMLIAIAVLITVCCILPALCRALGGMQ
jgi:hypothetical protein